jgi:hypothetical protein
MTHDSFDAFQIRQVMFRYFFNVTFCVIEQGSKFWQKIDCESEAKANFFSKKIAKRKRSERQIIFCEAKRSEFASLSQFFAILRKMRKFKRKFCSKKLREIFRVLQFCAFIVFLKKATHRITFMKKQDIQLVLVGF